MSAPKLTSAQWRALQDLRAGSPMPHHGMIDRLIRLGVAERPIGGGPCVSSAGYRVLRNGNAPDGNKS